MQKVINVLAVLSFVGTTSILATSGYVYWRRDAIADQVTENITKAATAAIADALPGMLDAAMPELPNATGGAVPALPPALLSDMKKLMMALAAALIAAPVMADPIKEDEYFTPHAQGCMLLQECTDHVQELKTVSDLNKHEELADVDYSIVADEFNSLVRSLNKVGAKVFLADMRYFPVGHRGVYHTVGNNFFLNVAHMHRPGTMMSVMRHEGWHAAQDCMAGTIENNFIAIIHNQEDVPRMYQAIAKSAYQSQPHAIPWEKEAYWAGHTEGMTAKALESCAAGTMWTDYDPTPMTREWLVEKGYISK